MQTIVKLGLVLAGVIHLLPVSGVLGGERLQALYGVAVSDPGLLLLMRHRALLFGMLGAFLIAAAWVPAIRTAALALGLFSALSFIVLAASGGPAGAAIVRIVLADWIAVALLMAAGVAHYRILGHGFGRRARL